MNRIISPNPFQAEIEYRRNRIRNEVAGTRRTRVPFVRRPGPVSDQAGPNAS